MSNQTRIQCNPEPTHIASDLLLGHNIEVSNDTVPGILSDRLDNPKFLGPPHPMTGIAPGWEGTSCGAGVRYELTPAAGLMGSEAQLVEAFGLTRGCLTQNRRKIRAGETLEVEIWARAWHEPVTLVVELLPVAATQSPYSSAEIQVDRANFMRYTATLTAPVDDDAACFSCRIKEYGAVWFDQIHLRPVDEPLLCKDFIERIATMRIPTIRFPGAIVTTSYNWRYGTGPVHLRPVRLDASYHRDWYMYYDFGTDEFLQLCLDQDIMPTLTVNLGAGTPDEAGEWAAYCTTWYRERGIDPPLIHWHMGNHPYYDDTMVHMTGEMYIAALRDYIPRIKQGYPNSRIVAVASPRSFCMRNGKNTPWLAPLLDEFGNIIDVVQIQTYCRHGIDLTSSEQWQGGDRDPEKMMAHMVDGLDEISGRLKTLIEECRSRGLDTKIGIAEWNYWVQASHRDGLNFFEPDYAIRGLFIAGMIHLFTRLAPDMEVAHFYNLVNVMGILFHRGPEVEETSAVDVFRLYRPAFPGEVFPLEIESTPLGKGLAVDGCCLRNEEGLWLFLSNRHPTEAATVSLDGIPGNAGKPASCEMLSSNAPVDRLCRKEVSADKGEINLPPLSIVRVEYAT